MVQYGSNLFLYHIGSKAVTNFIQLVFLQLVDHFSQTKLHWKAPNEGYSHVCEIYKSDNKLLEYQTMNNYKFH